MREMIGFAAQPLMELEVEARPGQITARRTPNVWPSATSTATGSGSAAAVELRIPKLRMGSYFPGFPEPRRVPVT
jgi:putative transposase